MRDIWKKRETFLKNFEKSELSPLFFEYQISYSVIFGDNRKLSEEI